MIKITKAMKMVAAAKLKHDEKRMQTGMPFVKPVQQLFERLPREDKSGSVSYLAMTSDKGLCGGVNSAVAKIARLGVVDEEAKGNTAKLVVIGNKGMAALKRQFGDRFTYTFEECATKPTKLKICSNKFKSLVAYDTVAQDCVTLTEA